MRGPFRASAAGCQRPRYADNLKITTPDELIRAELILASRRAGTVDVDPLTMPA